MSNSTINGGVTGIGAGAVAGLGTITVLNRFSGRMPTEVALKWGAVGGVVLGGMIGLSLEAMWPQHRGTQSTGEWAKDRAVRGGIIGGTAAIAAAGFLAATIGRANGGSALEAARLIGSAAVPAALFGGAAGAGISTFTS